MTREEFQLQARPSSEMLVNPNYEIIEESGVKNYLARIRPSWQAKQLVQRTMKILPVDPSSACQRIFNASIHDLREKIVIAGIDIAQEAAEIYKLPTITSEDDILERYNTSKLIDLTYRMGLITRPEYRRISRVYEIRKDLEHEDDEYEAGVEDVVYIFKTCIDVILANDPIQIIKLTEIKQIVESPQPITLDQAVVDDYKNAPDPRQTEIYKFLISISLDSKHPDIVRENCYKALASLSQYTNRNTILEVAHTFVDQRLGRRIPLLGEMRVANVAGIMPYLRTAHVSTYYEKYYERLESIGFHWSQHNTHGELLRDLIEIGGTSHCRNQDVKDNIIEWLIMCYIGEPGGYGSYGSNRSVFYSNTGARISLEIIEEDSLLTLPDIERILLKSKKMNKAIRDKHVMRRFQDILDKF